MPLPPQSYPPTRELNTHHGGLDQRKAVIVASVTCVLVSLGHVTRDAPFRRAFAGATVHDLFNLLTVAILFPVEMATGLLRHSATFIVNTLFGDRYELVLVNRKLEVDFSDGIDGVVKRIKADPQLGATPVMLLSNFPEAQEAAIRAGAEPGFGKAELDRPETLEKLARFLGE